MKTDITKVEFWSRYLFLIFVLILYLQPLSVYGETYQLSILPQYSSEECLKRVSPLVTYLSSDQQIELYLMNNFDQYLEGLKNGTIEIGYQNPYIYTLASQSHEVIAMAIKGEFKDKFRGIIITRSGSQIIGVEDLKGKKISYVGPTSAGGFLSQKLTLMNAGIDVDKDLKLVEAVANKQENVIFAVYSGDADAGFVRESALNLIGKFVPARAITIMKETEWLPNWAFSVKRSLPNDYKLMLKSKLIQLKKNHPLLKALKIDGFKAASDIDYNPVRHAAGLDIENR